MVVSLRMVEAETRLYNILPEEQNLKEEFSRIAKLNQFRFYFNVTKFLLKTIIFQLFDFFCNMQVSNIKLCFGLQHCNHGFDKILLLELILSCNFHFNIQLFNLFEEVQKSKIIIFQLRNFFFFQLLSHN